MDDILINKIEKLTKRIKDLEKLNDYQKIQQENTLNKLDDILKENRELKHEIEQK